jgi:hypothetical protein
MAMAIKKKPIEELQEGEDAPPLFLPAIQVPQIALGRDAVAHELFELDDVGETARLLARPERRTVQLDFEYAAGTGPQRERFDVAVEGGEQLLGHPRRTQQPATLGAVVNLDLMFLGHRAMGWLAPSQVE